MASLNIAEWSPDQVAEWLSGLGPGVERYAAGLRARGLDGAKLLTLRCDDLEYLGVHVIGHQELLLDAVDHLRNFQYEVRRECVQQLALRVCVVSASLARALRHHADARLETQALADVARVVRAVKPLVCWLDRWPLGAGAALAERKAALLKLALEAATCAQRDRFAEQPARAIAANAAATAAAAEYIVQEVSDPMILAPASLDTVTLRQGEKPLGFDVVPSFCGHHQLADIRFGSPAHASGAVHEGDEIVQVGGRCVIGWSGEAVVRACRARGGELALRLRRRAPALPLRVPRRPAPLLDRCELTLPRAELPAAAGPEGVAAASSSDESEPLSPPASPTHAHTDHTRMYPPKPRGTAQRRHSVSGGSPVARRRSRSIEQFWQELKQQRWTRGAGGSAGVSPEPDDCALYRRDKAVSCSTGLELSPRPRTCPGGALRPAPAPPAAAERRGKLDKAHSTPAYDFEGASAGAGALVAQTIPESPTTPTDSPTILVHSAEKADQILDFKKSSSQIGEAILQQQQSRRAPDEHDELGEGEAPDGRAPVHALNLALIEQNFERIAALTCEPFSRSPAASPARARAAAAAAASPPPPPPRPAPRSPPPGAEYPALRPVPRDQGTPDHKECPRRRRGRGGDAAHISLPLRRLAPHDLRVVTQRRAPADAAPAPAAAPARASDAEPARAQVSLPSPTRAAPAGAGGGVRGMFPSAKSRSLKKKNSLLAKRRAVSARALAAGAGAGTGAGAAPAGAVWQRVRARAAQQPRWARRHLLLAHNLLYAYRSPECSRADCMIHLAGFTASAAGEVKSRAHAFKVYHTGTAFYFACDSRDAMLAWIQLIHRATLLPRLAASPLETSKQFSETEYSESDSDGGERCERRARDAGDDRDKSKFGSLKKLALGGGGAAGARGEAREGAAPPAAASLDRKYLRFFMRHRSRDDAKPGKQAKQPGVPVPTEHYRSYRRVPPAPAPAPPAAPAARLPAPINYIHASNPNLLQWEQGALPRPPPLHARAHAHKPESFVGFVTLEEFMLQKQEEERRQVYTNRVLMGIERDRKDGEKAAAELQRRLASVVPDVVYGELQAPRSPRAAAKPVSVRGKDGYEKIVYPEDLEAERAPPPAAAGPDKWRDSLRRNDKVHSGAGGAGAAPHTPPPAAAPPAADSWGGAGAPGAGVSRLRLMFSGGRRDLPKPEAPGAGAARRGSAPSPPQPSAAAPHYPHLQCPPTFQPETYSLARLQPPEPRRRPDA